MTTDPQYIPIGAPLPEPRVLYPRDCCHPSGEWGRIEIDGKRIAIQTETITDNGGHERLDGVDAEMLEPLIEALREAQRRLIEEE